MVDLPDELKVIGRDVLEGITLPNQLISGNSSNFHLKIHAFLRGKELQDYLANWESDIRIKSNREGSRFSLEKPFILHEEEDQVTFRLKYKVEDRFYSVKVEAYIWDELDQIRDHPMSTSFSPSQWMQRTKRSHYTDSLKESYSLDLNIRINLLQLCESPGQNELSSIFTRSGNGSRINISTLFHPCMWIDTKSVEMKYSPIDFESIYSKDEIKVFLSTYGYETEFNIDEVPYNEMMEKVHSGLRLNMWNYRSLWDIIDHQGSVKEFINLNRKEGGWVWFSSFRIHELNR